MVKWNELVRKISTRQIIFLQCVVFVLVSFLTLAIHRTARISEMGTAGDITLWDQIYALAFMSVLATWMGSIGLALMGRCGNTYETAQSKFAYLSLAVIFAPASFLALQVVFPITLR